MNDIRTAAWSQKDPVAVVADDRERALPLLAQLRENPAVRLRVTRLPQGDFLVAGRFAVERKTWRDFAASLIDGRLFRQATGLARGSRRAVLVLEGNDRAADELGVSREALQGALVTLSVFLGLAVLRARDAAETVDLLVYIGRQAGRFANRALPRAGYRPKGQRARQLFILQGLPGVGPVRAERLLDRFGSVRGVAMSSAEELAVLDGIGAATAARIRWALGDSVGEIESDIPPTVFF